MTDMQKRAQDRIAAYRALGIRPKLVITTRDKQDASFDLRAADGTTSAGGRTYEDWRALFGGDTGRIKDPAGDEHVVSLGALAHLAGRNDVVIRIGFRYEPPHPVPAEHKHAFPEASEEEISRARRVT